MGSFLGFTGAPNPEPLWKSSPELVKILEIATTDLQAAIFRSVAENLRRATGALLTKKPELISAITKQGSTLLHIAAMRGNASMVNFLIEQGAVIDAPDEKGFTPLHHAAAAGHAATVNTLLIRGSKVDPVNKAGRTPLEEALENAIKVAAERNSVSSQRIETSKGFQLALQPALDVAMRLDTGEQVTKDKLLAIYQSAAQALKVSAPPKESLAFDSRLLQEGGPSYVAVMISLLEHQANFNQLNKYMETAWLNGKGQERFEKARPFIPLEEFTKGMINVVKTRLAVVMGDASLGEFLQQVSDVSAAPSAETDASAPHPSSS